MNKAIFFAILMIFGGGICTQILAQSVPASVKREISNQLTCNPEEKDIRFERIGPGKSGYSGQCSIGGEAVLYEKTARGIRKIFSGERQMNGALYLGRKAYNGFYEVNIDAHGAAYSSVETYRWNGSRFASIKCRSCDIDSNANMTNCRPC